MRTQKLYGQSMLIDGTKQLVHQGQIAFICRDDGRSEIQVGDETGFVMTIGKDNPLVAELVEAIRHLHEACDLRINEQDTA